MVIGSRFAAGRHDMSSLRRSVFRAIRSSLLNAFARDYPHQYLGEALALLVASRRGNLIGEVPVSMRRRQGGRPSAELYASSQATLPARTVLCTGTSFDLPPRS